MPVKNGERCRQKRYFRRALLRTALCWGNAMRRYRIIGWICAASVGYCGGMQLAEAQLQCLGAEQVSIGISSAAPNAESREPAVPPTGDFLVFSSKASNLTSLFDSGTSSNSPNIYRYSYSPSTGIEIELVSKNTSGSAPAKQSGEDLSFGCLAPSVSKVASNGSYAIAFHSDARDLVSQFSTTATSPATQVYITVPSLKRTVLITTTATATTNIGANQPSDQATVALIAENPNRYRVCFRSSASNVVTGQSGADKLYCREITESGGSLTLGTTTVVKSGSVNGSMGRPSLSADGTVLAFQSDATINPNQPGNGITQVYTYTFSPTGIFKLISASATEQAAVGGSEGPSLSSDGSIVAFTYLGPLEAGLAGTLKGLENVTLPVLVRHQVSTGINSRANTNSSGLASNGSVHAGRIDSTGRYVVFSDTGSNLADGATSSFRQVYLKDLESGLTVRTSVNSSNEAGNGESGFNSNSSFAAPLAIGYISATDTLPFVAFLSDAPKLASFGTPDSAKPFMYRALVVTPTPTPTPTPTATPTPRVLTKNIRITEPPDVNVTGRDAKGRYDIEVVCEQFGLDSSLIKENPDLVDFLASKKARLTYAVEIRKSGSKTRITRTSSRNVVTVRKLTPGSYTVRYRVVATKGKKKIQSRVSPRASITLS